MLLFDGRNEVRKRFLTSPWGLGSLCSDADAASAEYSPTDAGNPIPLGMPGFVDLLGDLGRNLGVSLPSLGGC